MDHFVIVLAAMLGLFLMKGNEQFVASSKVHLLLNFQLSILRICLHVVVQMSRYMSVHVCFGKCYL